MQWYYGIAGVACGEVGFHIKTFVLVKLSFCNILKHLFFWYRIKVGIDFGDLAPSIFGEGTQRGFYCKLSISCLILMVFSFYSS